MVDQSGNILQVDSQIEKLAGMPGTQLNQLNLIDLDREMNQEKLSEYWYKLETGERVILKTVWRSHQGESIPLDFDVCLISKKALGVAICRVITCHQVLGEQRALLQLFAEKQGVASWQWNIDDGTFSAMPNLLKILGQSSVETNGTPTNIIQLLKPGLSIKQQEAVVKAIGQLKKNKKGIKLPLAYHHQNNQHRSNLVLEAEPMFENQRLVAIYGVIQEVSDLPISGESDRLARITLDCADEMVFWINGQGLITYANHAALNNIGYDKSDLLDSLHLLKIAVELPQLEWKRFQRELEADEVVKMESTLQRKNGTVFPAILSFIKLENEVVCLLASNITQQRQEEAHLQSVLLQVQHLSRQLEAENRCLQEEVRFNFEEIVSISPAYKQVLKQLEQVAPTNSTVLIEGETGTGKELIARAIHRLSRRKDRPLVKVDCAALSDDLIESELFGHVKGAFTGADKDRVGRFELADHGTIFLDEIGELTAELQVKLLRVLQEGELQRLGSNRTVSINVRVIAATNRNLKKMVEEKQFREDLYYRLHVFPIENIPLRKRAEDIPLLIQHFLEKFSKKNGKPIPKVASQDLNRIKKYEFPGNVRELQNIIERASILTNDEVLDFSFWQPGINSKKVNNQFRTLEEVQRDHIIEALERTHWRVSGPDGAARLLDINPQTLFSRMRKLNISIRKDLPV